MKVQHSTPSPGRLGGRSLIGRAAVIAASLLLISVSGVVTAQTPGAYPDADVEMWSWNGGTVYADVFQDAADRFEAANEGATLERTYLDFAPYVSRAKTAIAGGVPPDLLQMPWAGEFLDLVKAGSLLPLDDYLDEDFPEFFPNVMESVTYDGKTWAVPLDLNNLLIGYNKDIFDELGLEVPTTSDELIAVAQAIREDGRYQPLVTSPSVDSWQAADLWFAQAAYAVDSDATLRSADQGQKSWDDPEFVAAAEQVKKLLDGGVFSDDMNSLGYIDAVTLFAQGQAAMIYPVGNFILDVVEAESGGPGALNYDLMAFPPPEAGMTPVATGGIAIMFALPADAGDPAAAHEVLRYMTNEDGRSTLIANRFIPSSEADSSLNPDPIYGKMLDFQKTARTRAIFTPETYAALVNGMQELLAGAKDPAGVAADMVAAQEG